MARKTKFSKDSIMKSSINFVKEKGYEILTVRELALYIGCSTQPIFKNYTNFNSYKDDLKIYLRKDYESYVNKDLNKDDYLFSISYLYASYALVEPNIFKSLFMADLAGSRTVEEVLNTERNMETIKSMVTKYNISLEKAKKVYRDVRFYTHGIATQLAVKSITLSQEDLKTLIQDNIKINLKEEL